MISPCRAAWSRGIGAAVCLAAAAAGWDVVVDYARDELAAADVVRRIAESVVREHDEHSLTGAVAPVPDIDAVVGELVARVSGFAPLQPLLDVWQQQVDAGEGELNFPPDYPKMAGEPPRVQPSKKVAEHWDEQGNRVEGT